MFTIALLTDGDEVKYLVGPEGDLAAAPCAAPDAAVIAHMAHTVRELGLETDVAGRFEFNPCLLVLLVPLAYRLLEHLYLVLLPSETTQPLITTP